MLPGVLVALATLVLVGTQSPAQTKPNFSGSWTVESGLPGWGVEGFTVIQTTSAIVIQVTKGNGVRLESKTYRITADSRTSDSPRAYWINDALAIHWETELDVYSFDLHGRLVVMRLWTPTDNGTMGTSRVVYQRH